MRVLYLFIPVLMFCSQILMAQSNPKIKQANYGKGLVYSRERAMIIEGHTNGMNLGYEWGKLRSYYKTTFYQLSIGYMKHNRETRTPIAPTNFSLTSAFSYGKQNILLPLTLTYGEKRFRSEKDLYRGVAVGTTYSIGPTLGILKPYYLVYVDGKDNKIPTNIRYSEENAKKFLDKDFIRGAASFSEGLGELSFQPAATGRAAMHFDWGAFDEYARALEVGFVATVFFKKIPILVDNAQNKMIFLNFYANLQFGKRK